MATTTSILNAPIKCGMSCGRDVEAVLASSWVEGKTAQYYGTRSIGDLDEWLAIEVALRAPLCVACDAVQRAVDRGRHKTSRDLPKDRDMPPCRDCSGKVGPKAWSRFLDDAYESWRGYLNSTVKTWLNTSGGRIPAGDDYKSLADYALGKRDVFEEGRFSPGVVIRPRCMKCRKAHNGFLKKSGYGLCKPTDDLLYEPKESF